MWFETAMGKVDNRPIGRLSDLWVSANELAPSRLTNAKALGHSWEILCKTWERLS